MRLRILFVALLICLNSTCALAQAFVGLRDNRFGIVGYTLKNKYSFMAEQSLYSQKPNTQHVRAIVSFNHSIRWLDYGAYAYYGSEWDGGYYDCGGSAWMRFVARKIGSIDFVVNPHYDSGDKFHLCVKAGITVRIKDEVSFIAHYSSIPEYRMVENRIRVGFRFKKEHLQVTPVISYPLNEEPRTLRVLTSFLYHF